MREDRLLLLLLPALIDGLGRGADLRVAVVEVVDVDADVVPDEDGLLGAV